MGHTYSDSAQRREAINLKAPNRTSNNTATRRRIMPTPGAKRPKTGSKSGKKTSKGQTSGMRRGGGPRALATNVPGITKKTFGKRGLAEGGLISDWARIVGPDLASSCQPERLAHPPRERSGGTLHIRVHGGAATELQHLEPLILERINGHFGYRAVARLRLVHAPLTPFLTDEPDESPVPAPLNPDQQANLDTIVAEIDDPELRAAMARIGGAILARSAVKTGKN
jgi:hypothetical protein